MLVSFVVVSILYTVMSIPLSFAYDIMINMDVFNLERRSETAQILQYGWAAIPIAFLLTIMGYGVQRSLQERAGY